MQIKGSKILITGGSSGVGKATATLLRSLDADVMIVGKDKDKLEKVGNAIGAISVAADISEQESIDRIFEVIKHQWDGKLNCLVNNAAVGEFCKLEEVTLEAFERVFRVNVFGTAMITQKAVEIFRKQQSGNIITIGGSAAVDGFPTGTVYAASKAAVRNMTQTWRKELRGSNIRVTLINPSEMTTGFPSPQDSNYPPQGVKNRPERPSEPTKLRGEEVAHLIRSILEVDDRGFVPELNLWATNPSN
ncbi:SDR family oxidoreductase [Limibacter armeniacum]|uniref:SDR family oxidoreductase n=1 Tax=Limibacter armeniacum TaxID=466084 RepID=UPI002FE6628C